jgi:light-harvesting complex 1 beta chain
MAETEVVVTNDGSNAVVFENDMVPDPWKGLFTNEEWLMHDIVVKSTYGFMIIAIIAHTLVYLWQPWLGN